MTLLTPTPQPPTSPSPSCAVESWSYDIWWKNYSISSKADPGINFGGPNQGPQSKVNGEARIEGPSIEGKARVDGAKRLRNEGEARTEGEAREKAGGGVWGGGSVSPSPEN